MSWSRFDDLYDEHEKVQDAWDAHPATIGLHVMATTACNRWLSDGVIRPRWLNHKLPVRRDRDRILKIMVDVELFDLLPAGETIERGDSAGNQIVVGPYAEPRYVVHDFLDRHDSSIQIKARRAKDAARKRPGVQTASNGTPRGIRVESNGTPRASRAGVPSLPIPKDPPEPPKGGRTRDRETYEQRLREWASDLLPGVDADAAYFAVKAGLSHGASTRDAVLAGVRQWHPELVGAA